MISIHRRRYTLSGLLALVTEHDLQVLHASYFNFVLFPVILPVILGLKAKQALWASDSDTTNLSFRVPRRINRVLAAVLSSERHVVSKWRVPFGHSMLLVARKN